jgi:CHAT domain-containing protein
VDDAATAQLMTHFYRHWQRNGRRAAPALQQAQQALRQTHPHPYHWAAFVLHGGAEG